MKNKILNGLQYLSFIKLKEACCKLTKPRHFSIENFEKEIAEKKANRSIEEWIEIEIGNRLFRTYENISFFFRITLPEYFIRGKQGWAKSDTWELDGYLSNVIKESVLHLEKMVHGHPCGLKNLKQWKSILKKIAWTFDKAGKIGDDWVYIPSKKYTRKQYNKFKKHTKYMHIMTKTEALKYEEGWKLFQEYFQNLWD